MRNLALGLALCVLAWSGTASGQLPKYNPYAPTQDDPLPVGQDGKLNWPAFFKDKAKEDRFQGYFKIGACVGTREEINTMLKNNKVNVNALPESAVQGQAASLGSGTVIIADAAGKKTLVVTHPAGVSKVSVSGPMTIRQLKPEMIVRFIGRVDAHGMGVDPVDSLEVVTPDADFRWPQIEADKLTTVTAKVVKLTANRIQVQLPAGKLRKLTFTLADEPKVNVDSSSLALIGAGDAVSAKGRTYTGPGAGGIQVVFASDVTITKALAASANTQ